jgi:nucleoid DNA-binding protein
MGIRDSDAEDSRMQKTDFVKAVAEKAKMSQKDTKEIIDAALEVIADQLKAGDKVTLHVRVSTHRPARRSAFQQPRLQGSAPAAP